MSIFLIAGHQSRFSVYSARYAVHATRLVIASLWNSRAAFFDVFVGVADTVAGKSSLSIFS